jgi:hypothetical protein
METDGRQRTRKSKSYRIVVRAEIGERFAAAFEGMDVKISEGQTIISGRSSIRPTCTESWIA